VSGSKEAWVILRPRFYPLPVSSYPALSPEQVLQVLPVAHFYDFQAVLTDCIAAAVKFCYSAADTPSSPSPLPFIAMAERLQVG